MTRHFFNEKERTVSTTPEEQRAKELAAAAARIVQQGIGDTQSAVDFVTSQERGTALGRLVNNQRGQIQQPQKPQEKQ